MTICLPEMAPPDAKLNTAVCHRHTCVCTRAGGYLLQVMQCARHCDVIMSQQCIQQRGADRCYADAVFNARGLNNTGGNGTAGGGGTGSRPLPSVAGPPPPPAPALVVQDSSNDKDRLLLILLTTIVGGCAFWAATVHARRGLGRAFCRDNPRA